MKILLFCFVVFPATVLGQDFFSFLSPESPNTSIELEGIYLPQSDFKGSADRTQVMNTAVGVNQKVYEDDLYLASIGAKYQKLDLTAESKFLNDFYNQQGSVALKRKLTGDKFWLGSLSYGSASDRPFKNARDNTLSANYIQKFSERWLGMVNYSNNRPFLNNIPLPGFIYVKEMTREKSFVIGFPFVLWSRPVVKDWSIRYFGLIPWAHRLRILYTKWGFVRPYGGFEQTPQSFFRDGRQKRYDRFFWFERRVALGVEGNLGRSLRLDFSSGLAFDRQFYEAKNFSDSKDLVLDLENAYFASLNLRYNF